MAYIYCDDVPSILGCQVQARKSWVSIYSAQKRQVVEKYLLWEQEFDRHVPMLSPRSNERTRSLWEVSAARHQLTNFSGLSRYFD